ncbi:MAG: hypothetical protein M1840_005407 [Geoglossum simile]|nr:MAG: hypothetical protein M1840_005407 [Geoglossum simile]
MFCANPLKQTSPAATPVVGKRKRGPVGDPTSPMKWGTKISECELSSLGSTDSQPTKKFKGGTQLDFPDIFPSRFTSRNSFSWSDDIRKEPDILKASPHHKSPASTPKEPTTRSQHNRHSSISTLFSEEVITISSDSDESDDNFEELMSRRIAAGPGETAKGSATSPKAASEASRDPAVKPEGPENEIRSSDPERKLREDSLTLQERITAKYERAHAQERAAESAALRPEQHIRSLKAELDMITRISRIRSTSLQVKSRASEQRPTTDKRAQEAGTEQKADGITKAPRDSATRGKMLAAVGEDQSHCDEPVVPFVRSQNPSKGSPMLVKWTDVSELEAARRRYAAIVSTAEAAASQRATVLSKSLGFTNTVPLRRARKSPEKGANTKPKKVAFDDTPTRHRFNDHVETRSVAYKLQSHRPSENGAQHINPRKDAYTTPTGSSYARHQPGERLKSPKEMDIHEEPERATFSRNSAGQRPKAYKGAEKQEDGRESAELPEKMEYYRRAENTISRDKPIDQRPKEHEAVEQQADEIEPSRPSENEDIYQEPETTAAEAGQESKASESLLVGQPEEGSGAPKSTKRGGSRGELLTNRKLTEGPPEGHEGRTVDLPEGRESDDSIIEAPLPHLSTPTLEVKRKKSLAKRRKYSVNEETYWEYRVILSTWRDDSDPPLQHHCGTYFNRESANRAARDQVFPPGAADPFLYDEYHKEKDEFGMDLYSAQSARGHILVFTQRVLRYKAEANAPNESAKKTWLNPKVYVIWEKYVEYEEPKPDDDDLFGEAAAKEREIKSITSIMVGIHTTRSFANKAASDHSMDRLRRSAIKNGRTNTQNEVAIIELEMQSREHLKTLEEVKDLYNSEIEVMGTNNELSVWVDEVDLIGPRN